MSGTLEIWRSINMSNGKMNEVLEQYAKRVCLGSYVPCEICRNLHDDGGLMTYKGKEVYVCLDCLEASEEERNKREKQ